MFFVEKSWNVEGGKRKGACAGNCWLKHIIYRTYLLKTRVRSSNSRTCTSYSKRKEGTKTNVSSRDQSKFKNLAEWCSSLGSTGSNSSFVQSRWGLSKIHGGSQREREKKVLETSKWDLSRAIPTFWNRTKHPRDSNLEIRRQVTTRHVQRHRLGSEGWLRYCKSIATSSKEAKNERSSKHGDFKNCMTWMKDQ